MFEYPGSRMGDDLYNDVKDIKAWLNRFVPELEQQLYNLGTDNFTSAYNERVEGLTTLSGAPGSKTTAEAVAEHLLDYNNPHKVTLGQLGYQEPEVQAASGQGSTILVLCGLMIQIKTVEIDEATAEAEGNVFKQSLDTGDWEAEFLEFYGATAVINTGDLWLGGIADASTTSAGTLTIYSAAAAAGEGTATIIGIGRV